MPKRPVDPEILRARKEARGGKPLKARGRNSVLYFWPKLKPILLNSDFSMFSDLDEVDYSVLNKFFKQLREYLGINRGE